MKSYGFTNIIGEKYNGMLACYHLHVDPQLSINKSALQRMPCAYKSCANKLSLRWIDNVAAENQPRFSHNDRCKYINIFGHYNDWIIINISKKNPQDLIENEDDLKKDVLIGITDRIVSDIEIGNIGAFMYNINDSYGYDLLKFDSKPYKIQYNSNEHCLKKVIKWWT